MQTFTPFTSPSRALGNYQDLSVGGNTASKNPDNIQAVLVIAEGTLNAAGASPADAELEFALIDNATGLRLKSVYVTLATTGYQTAVAGDAADAEDDVAVLSASTPTDARGIVDLLGLDTSKNNPKKPGGKRWVVGCTGVGGYKSITVRVAGTRRV